MPLDNAKVTKQVVIAGAYLQDALTVQTFKDTTLIRLLLTQDGPRGGARTTSMLINPRDLLYNLRRLGLVSK